MPSGTNSQTTQYNYGVTTSGSNLYSNDLLASIQYPDKTSGNLGTNSSDKQSFTYNTIGQTLTFTDQNGNVHTYSYDLLGRKIADAITTLGSGVDGSVLRQTINFDTGGRPYQLTQYNAASGGSVGPNRWGCCSNAHRASLKDPGMEAERPTQARGNLRLNFRQKGVAAFRTEWSDGESNPDLLNAIQPSSR